MALELKIQTAEPVHKQIEKQLRALMKVGEMKPGQRLPSTPKLAEQLGVSCTAVQRAMNRLHASGMIERTRRRGTFVRDVTETALVGLLFGVNLTHANAYAYRAMLTELQAALRIHDWVGRFYDGLTRIEGLEQSSKIENLHNLRRDLFHYPFKGLIVFSPRREWLQLIKGDGGRLPQVCFYEGGDDSDFVLDRNAFVRDSVAYLADLGRRRLALVNIIAQPHPRTSGVEALHQEAQARGIEPPTVLEPEVMLYLPRAEADLCNQMRQAIRQWKSRPGGLPDGLIVRDDVGMRAIAWALLMEGVRVPEDITVVCLANEGVNLFYGFPVVRWEISTGESARQMVDLLWRRMTGQALPDLPVAWSGTITQPG